MARNFWDPSESMHGLFDVWSFRNIEAVVSSGLGGGSLIYANVLLRKDPAWFVDQPLPGGGGREQWPVTRADLDPHYTAVEKMLKPQRYPFDAVPFSETPKTRAMFEAAQRLGLEVQLPPLAVIFGNEDQAPAPNIPIKAAEYPNLHNRPRTTCQLVGECDIGCNYGSKNSLDHTYLSAAAAHGAVIRTLSDVQSFEPVEDGYLVGYTQYGNEGVGASVDQDGPRRRTIRCRRLVLATGALGTTYLLLRNRAMFPDVSPMLGTRFSGNGDFLGLVMEARDAGGLPRRMDPSLGPVITSALRMPDAVDDGGSGRGFYLEDAGYPQLVNWLVQAGLPAQSLRLGGFLLSRLLARVTDDPRSRVGSSLSHLLGSGRLTATSLLLLGMGRDVPNGRMSLRNGYLDIDWNQAASLPYFRTLNKTMRDIAHILNGTYASDPLWWMNLLITVHPLGGCPMGDDPSRGVVDPMGRVYGYSGLSIADGSVLPGPVGANPSLTIAALADRFASAMLADDGLAPAESSPLERKDDHD
jgi:cholesterol oxidase